MSSKSTTCMWPGKEEGAKPKKQLALAAALKQVEMTYGKGSIMQLGSKDVEKVRKQVAQGACKPVDE